MRVRTPQTHQKIIKRKENPKENERKSKDNERKTKGQPEERQGDDRCARSRPVVAASVVDPAAPSNERRLGCM